MHLLSCTTVVRQCTLELCYCAEARDLKAMLLWGGDALNCATSGKQFTSEQ